MLPEAPASVTYSLISPLGYGVLYTVRAETAGELFEEMDAIEQGLVDKGYKSKEGPVKSGGGKTNKFQFSKQEPVGDGCPKCGAPLSEIEAKGRPAVRCSTNKWDPETKTASGCDYFAYADEQATTAQKKVLEDTGQWKEGMLKGEASYLIGQLKK